MDIRPITTTDWPNIMTIQASCYGKGTVESQQVLQAKVQLSPQTCLVVVINQQIAAYVLAHPRPLFTAPKLHVEQITQATQAGLQTKSRATPLHNNPQAKKESCLYIHDLAVNRAFQHQGLAKQLFSHLTVQPQALSHAAIALISLPTAQAFWQKQGFILAKNNPDTLQQSLESYPANSQYMIKAN